MPAGWANVGGNGVAGYTAARKVGGIYGDSRVIVTDAKVGIALDEAITAFGAG